jgi:hypothetical protein
LFVNPEDAELMCWHASVELKDDGKLRHSSDASNEKNSMTHPKFAEDPRNIRFALNTDGMNPFAERSSKHITSLNSLHNFYSQSYYCLNT